VKRCISLLVFLLSWSSIAASEVQTREQLIGRVKLVYFQSHPVFSTDSPFTGVYLHPAKLANPRVSPDTWLAISEEIVRAMYKPILVKNGPFDRLLRDAMENLSDKELNRLGQILSDPAYAKFYAAMNSPATQEALLQSLAGIIPQIHSIINEILVKHGLNEIAQEKQKVFDNSSDFRFKISGESCNANYECGGGLTCKSGICIWR